MKEGAMTALTLYDTYRSFAPRNKHMIDVTHQVTHRIFNIMIIL